MPSYYTQNASAGATTVKFYGRKDEHDHDSANKFTQAISSYMSDEYEDEDVRLSDFRSGQSRVPTGGNVVQMRWQNRRWNAV
jgi:hypothetical protein